MGQVTLPEILKIPYGLIVLIVVLIAVGGFAGATLVEKMMETIVRVNEKGVTVLLVEQMVQEALEIAHRGYVLQTGRIVQTGPARKLLDSEEVRKAYMGM